LATLLFFCFSAPEWKQSGIIRYYMVLWSTTVYCYGNNPILSGIMIFSCMADL
jgi:hypothetical protein